MRVPHPAVVALIALVAGEVGLGTVLHASQCRDGWDSPSIGYRGACSHHGGVDRGPDFLRNLLAIALAGGASWVAFRLRNPAIKSQGVPVPPPWPSPTPAAAPSPPIEPGTDDGPQCPRCGKPMLLRTARKGAHAGEEFYGCSGYPVCNGIRSVTGRPVRRR